MAKNDQQQWLEMQIISTASSSQSIREEIFRVLALPLASLSMSDTAYLLFFQHHGRCEPAS
uniref:Uncharacterized protein n=1 Tax=Oryza punctata TaxID=4537 RepID=A0A0E0M0W2_ORYPU